MDDKKKTAFLYFYQATLGLNVCYQFIRLDQERHGERILSYSRTLYRDTSLLKLYTPLTKEEKRQIGNEKRGRDD